MFLYVSLLLCVFALHSPASCGKCSGLGMASKISARGGRSHLQQPEGTAPPMAQSCSAPAIRKRGQLGELGDGRPWGASKIGSIGSWIDVQDTCWYMDWSDSIRTHTLNHPRKEHEWHMLKRSSIVQLGTLARGSKLSSTIAIILECSCGVCRKCFTPQIQSIGFPSMIGHSWQFWKCIGGWGSPNGRKKPDWP